MGLAQSIEHLVAAFGLSGYGATAWWRRAVEESSPSAAEG